jgi:aminoglycoside 6'-N-acetyltransferase I
MLKEQNNILLVAINEGVVIGQVLAVIHRHPDKPTESYIDDLGVSEKFRRRGIATRLLKQLYIIGVERGCEEVWVATEPDNEPAIKFYNSLNLEARKVICHAKHNQYTNIVFCYCQKNKLCVKVNRIFSAPKQSPYKPLGNPLQ